MKRKKKRKGCREKGQANVISGTAPFPPADFGQPLIDKICPLCFAFFLFGQLRSSSFSQPVSQLSSCSLTLSILFQPIFYYFPVAYLVASSGKVILQIKRKSTRKRKQKKKIKKKKQASNLDIERKKRGKKTKKKKKKKRKKEKKKATPRASF